MEQKAKRSWDEFIKQIEPSKSFLYHTSCKNFIEEQPHRFLLIAGEKCVQGTMLFCASYLDAQVLMSLEDSIGLYSDYATGEFVVCIAKEWR